MRYVAAMSAGIGVYETDQMVFALRKESAPCQFAVCAIRYLRFVSEVIVSISVVWFIGQNRSAMPPVATAGAGEYATRLLRADSMASSKHAKSAAR